MSVSPVELDALRLLGYFYLNQRLDQKAATVFTALDRLSPQSPGILRALAVTHDRLGQYAKALEAMDRLAMTGAIDPQFHALRAKVLGCLDRWDEARQAMSAAVQSRQQSTTPNPQKQVS